MDIPHWRKFPRHEPSSRLARISFYQSREELAELIDECGVRKQTALSYIKKIPMEKLTIKAPLYWALKITSDRILWARDNLPTDSRDRKYDERGYSFATAFYYNKMLLYSGWKNWKRFDEDPCAYDNGSSWDNHQGPEYFVSDWIQGQADPGRSEQYLRYIDLISDDLTEIYKKRYPNY